ncbi:hypothetical protein NDU88_008669 [Pleurodeles waltl]|uniref:Uncharacterized protein n=1 Tax=Pleurodeles waltl TaxID=8319 RepID=A0AAV7NZX5_PLEWA|nr:hypothetical protein NDU88_008669 [Pleurodeles waltl]
MRTDPFLGLVRARLSDRQRFHRFAPCSVLDNMAQQYPDEDQYGEYEAGHYDQHMEERLVEASDFHVQDLVNKALVKAVRPFAQPNFNYEVMRFGAGSGNPTPVEVNNINEPGWSSYDPVEETISVVLNDHKYDAFRSHKTTNSFKNLQNTTDKSNSSDSDVDSTRDKPMRNRKQSVQNHEDSSAHDINMLQHPFQKLRSTVDKVPRDQHM